MNTTTVIWVTDRHSSSLVTFSHGIAEVTFTVIALAIISGNGWYKSLYPSFLIPHSAQLLLSRGRSHLSLMFPPSHSQAFMWQDAASLCFKSFTYSKFLQRLRSALHTLGPPARDYTCHSFRRGGASFAFQAGLPVGLTKILRDLMFSQV